MIYGKIISVSKSTIRNLKSKILWGVFLLQVTGRFSKNKTWRLLDGRTWEDMPGVLEMKRVKGLHFGSYKSQIKIMTSLFPFVLP